MNTLDPKNDVRETVNVTGTTEVVPESQEQVTVGTMQAESRESITENLEETPVSLNDPSLIWENRQRALIQGRGFVNNFETTFERIKKELDEKWHKENIKYPIDFDWAAQMKRDSMTRGLAFKLATEEVIDKFGRDIILVGVGNNDFYGNYFHSCYWNGDISDAYIVPKLPSGTSELVVSDAIKVTSHSRDTLPENLCVKDLYLEYGNNMKVIRNLVLDNLFINRVNDGCIIENVIARKSIEINETYARFQINRIRANAINIDRCWNLSSISLKSGQSRILNISKCPKLTEIKAPGNYFYTIELTDCRLLSSLPSKLKVHELLITNCEHLISLPEDLEADEIIINNCPNLKEIPERLRQKCTIITK